MLDWSYGLKEEARAIEAAIEAVITQSPTTPDLLGGTGTTSSVGDAVCAHILAHAKVTP